MQTHVPPVQRHPAFTSASTSTTPTPSSPTSLPKHIKFTEPESPLIHASETPAPSLPQPLSPSSPTISTWAPPLPPPPRYTPRDETRALARATSRRFRRYVRDMCEADALVRQLEEEEEEEQVAVLSQIQEEEMEAEPEEGPLGTGVRRVDHFRFEFPFEFDGSEEVDEDQEMDEHEEEEEVDMEEHEEEREEGMGEHEEEGGEEGDEGVEEKGEDWEDHESEGVQGVHLEDQEQPGNAYDPHDEGDSDYNAESEHQMYDDNEQEVEDEECDEDQDWCESESYSRDSSQELVSTLRVETRKLSEELAQSRHEMKRMLGQIKTRLGKVAKAVKRKRLSEEVVDEEELTGKEQGVQVEEANVEDSITKRIKLHDECKKGYPFVSNMVWTLGSAALGAVLGVAAVGVLC